MAEAQFTGQTYGTRAQQERAQDVVPTGPPPTDVVPFGAPSQRPTEPVTAGLPMGAGPGPEAIQSVGIQPGSREDVMLRLRAIAARYPNPALLEVLAQLESQ
jgi:hypothetical protein